MKLSRTKEGRLGLEDCDSRIGEQDILRVTYRGYLQESRFKAIIDSTSEIHYFTKYLDIHE